MKRGCAGVAVMAWLAGCAVGPSYRTPSIEVPTSFAEAGGDRAASAALRSPGGDGNDGALTQWWQQFEDPELQSLVSRALESNLDLQSAASRIRQARDQEVIAGAAGLPQVSATGAAVNLHANSNPLGALGGSGMQSGGAQGAGLPAGTGATDLKLYSAGFDATWELDVFGTTRRGVEAARASEEASVWQLRDAQVSLSAEVAVDYLTLCAARERLAIVRDTIEREKQTLQLTDARRKAGFVSGLDVNQQRAQLAATSAELPSLEAEERATVRSLTVLLARNPEEVPDDLLHTAMQLPKTPQALPVALPSELLRRRPDVRAAERRLASSTAEVGVAVANLYPHFDLIAATTFASDSLNALVQSRNFNRIGIGLIRWPVFQAGKGRANVRAREEERQQSYLAYRKAVLTALQDAEGALSRFLAEQQRLSSLLEAEQAADSSLSIAQAQYRNGVVPFIDVLTANSTLLQAQGQIVQSRMALAQAAVSVYKALGGGWQAPQADGRDR